MATCLSRQHKINLAKGLNRDGNARVRTPDNKVLRVAPPPSEPGERWVNAPGWPRYMVSSNGRVSGPIAVLRPAKKRGGYLFVSLHRDGKQTTVDVHVLVLKAFAGPRPSRQHHAMHIDGTRTNNHLSNLRWGTTKENEADKIRHGTVMIGDRHPHVKLNDSQVRDIRSRKRFRGMGPALAKEFGVNRHTINNIVAGRARKYALEVELK